MTQSTADFDDAGLGVESSGEIPFKEAVMLLCRWWYPTKEHPLCVVDAVHVTRAEPTEAGARVVPQLTLIARSMSIEAGSGVIVHGPSVFCALDESDTAAALKRIEAGVDPLYFRFKRDPNLDKALSTQVEPLAAIYQSLAMEDLLGSNEREKPPAAQRI